MWDLLSSGSCGKLRMVWMYSQELVQCWPSAPRARSNGARCGAPTLSERIVARLMTCVSSRCEQEPKGEKKRGKLDQARLQHEARVPAPRNPCCLTRCCSVRGELQVCPIQWVESLVRKSKLKEVFATCGLLGANQVARDLETRLDRDRQQSIALRTSVQSTRQHKKS